MKGAATTRGTAKMRRVLISSPTIVFIPDTVVTQAKAINVRLAYLCTARYSLFCLSMPKSGWRNSSPAAPGKTHPPKAARPAAQLLYWFTFQARVISHGHVSKMNTYRYFRKMKRSGRLTPRMPRCKVGLSHIYFVLVDKINSPRCEQHASHRQNRCKHQQR